MSGSSQQLTLKKGAPGDWVCSVQSRVAPLTPFQSNWRKVEVRLGRIGAMGILRGMKICNDFPLIFNLFPYFNKKVVFFYTCKF